jgi:hypothetical protein
MTSAPTPTKACRKCGEAKPLLAFAGRQNTCIACRDAAKARTLERKARIEYSPALAAKIADMIAMRVPVAKVAEMAGFPTQRQIASWRRTIPEFREMLEEARIARADARSDRVDQLLDDLVAGKIDHATARVAIEAELKLASKEAPARYGDVTKVQQEISGPNGAPLAVSVVDDASLIKAARWVADLLSRADRMPALDLKPEEAKAA